MQPGMFVAEILFATIFMGSISLVVQFVISKNGWLRKLMIIFFSSLAWCVAVSGIYLYFSYNNSEVTDFWTTGNVAVSPLAISILLIFVYLVKQNLKRKP